MFGGVATALCMPGSGCLVPAMGFVAAVGTAHYYAKRAKAEAVAGFGAYTGLLVGAALVEQNWLSAGLSFSAFVMNLAFHFRLVPGFDNPLVIEPGPVSDSGLAPDFRLYHNLGKAGAGLIGMLAMGLQSPHASMSDLDSPFKATLGVTAVTVMSMVAAAQMLGVVDLDEGKKKNVGLFSATNLLFTCTAEAVTFGRFLQDGVKAATGSSALALLLSSVAFGLAHKSKYAPSVYPLLSGLAGLGYAAAYQTTGDLRSMIAAHFAVNYVHYTALTYPWLKEAVAVPAVVAQQEGDSAAVAPRP